MKYCTHCGKELLDEAVVCPGCGCAAEQKVEAVAGEPITSFGGKASKLRLILVVLTPALIFVIVPALLVIMILSSHDIKMKDFKDVSKIGAMFQFGNPGYIDGGSDDFWMGYGKHISFYGIPVKDMKYFHDKDRATPSFILQFDEKYTDEVLEILKKNCEVENVSDSNSLYAIEYNDNFYGQYETDCESVLYGSKLLIFLNSSDAQ